MNDELRFRTLFQRHIDECMLKQDIAQDILKSILLILSEEKDFKQDSS